MATLPVINGSGSSVGDFEVDDAWLEREKGTQAVHDVVVAYQAAGRARWVARARSSACSMTSGPAPGKGTCSLK